MTAAFCSACLTAKGQTPNFKTHSRVAEETALTAEKKDLIKQLKKTYKAQAASVQRWVDGECYIVLRRGSNSLFSMTGSPGFLYTLFDLSGNPIFGSGGDVEWFNKLTVEKKDGHSFFYYTKDASEKNFGLKYEDGKTIFSPADNFKAWEPFYTSGGQMYVSAYVIKLGKRTLYKTDGTKITTYNTLYAEPALKEGYETIPVGDSTMQVWHKAYDELFYKYGEEHLQKFTEIIDTQGNLLKKINNWYQTLVPGYGITNPFPNQTNVIYPERINGNISMKADIGYESNKFSLVTADGQTLIDSCYTVAYVSPCDVLVYSAVVDGECRMGSYDILHPEASIAPLFSELRYEKNADGTLTAYVRPTLLSEEVKYKKGKEYPRVYLTEAEKLLERSSLFQLFKYFEDKPLKERSRRELLVSAMASLRTAKTTAHTQSQVLEHYSLETPPLNESENSKSDAMFDQINPKDFSWAAFFTKCVDEWSKNGTPAEIKKADEMKRQMDILLGSLYLTRDSVIPRAREAYLERCKLFYEKQKLQQEEQRKAKEMALALEKAKLERMKELKRQREEAMQQAIINMVSGIVANALSSFTQTPAKTTKAKATTAKVGTTAAKGGAASAGSDNSGDKASLKRQIAEWESKIKKAEASLEEASLIYMRQKTWESKSVMQSKENTVNEYRAERDKLVEQLNALK